MFYTTSFGLACSLLFFRHDAAVLADMGYRLVGADHNPVMIDICKKNRQVLIDSGSNIEWGKWLVIELCGVPTHVICFIL